jgi:flagellar operon protein (TIGR03826 family)
MKNAFRSVCQSCFKEEEKFFDIVYKYMRKRENRAATITQVIEATEIPEELLYRFIRNGRFHLTQFPNFGYPCDKCGHVIRSGKLCDKCTNELRGELQIFEQEEERKKEINKRTAAYLRDRD